MELANRVQVFSRLGREVASNPGSHRCLQSASDEKLDESLGSRLGGRGWTALIIAFIHTPRNYM